MTPVTFKVTQGHTETFSQKTPNNDGTFGGIYSGTEQITATVWAGDSQTALVTQVGSPNAWNNAANTDWSITLVDSQTTTLAPGIYRLVVSAQPSGTSGETGTLFDGICQVFSAAGSSTDTADLATYTYVETLLRSIKLKEHEREMIPALKAEASDAIRKWCGQRDFNQQSYSEEYNAEENGYIPLKQFPVNCVTRVRGFLQTAINITAQSSAFASAFVQWTFTGTWYANTLTYTGITLIAYQNGVQVTNVPLLFSTYLTVGTLAAAINAVSGWSAFVTGAMGNFATHELAMASTGTAQGAMSDDGAELLIYSEDLTTTRLNNAIGFLWTGRRRISSQFGGRWGEDGGDLADMDAPAIGRVRVDYNAGFSPIPTPIQLACAELVKFKIMQLRRDETLMSETAQKYSYEISDQMVRALPKHVLDGISKYVIHRAR